MPTRPQRWLRILLVVALVLGGAYWWFFLEVPAAAGEFHLDLAEVRALAASIAGDPPQALRVERVAEFKFPGAITRAGNGWGMIPMTIFSWQLVFPTHTAIVDTALTDPFPGATVDRGSFGRMSRALAAADLIVVTHEHSDHLGGLVAQPNLKALLKVAKLNRAQVTNSKALEPAKFPPGALDGYQPTDYERYLAVAPGVVLIRAPGHTPGSQLVYVRRADGVEFLLLGDVAWRRENVALQGERPRAITLLIGEDRAPVVSQLAELHRLSLAEPALHQIPGHDPEVVQQLLAAHLVEDRFQP